jgi:uncharacterized protein
MNPHSQRLPILDMHLHAFPADAMGPPPQGIGAPYVAFPAWDQAEPYGAAYMRMMKDPPGGNVVWSPTTDQELIEQTVAVMERLNIIGVVSGSAERVVEWRAAAPHRLMPGLLFQLDDDTPSPEEVRRLHEQGHLAVFGEVVIHYQGITPDDERMAPYWALAEDLDIPVGIHVGTGPPGAPYLGMAGYRARLHSPLVMEEVLLRYPSMRVYLMHAGFPMLDDLLAVLYTHPQVHVDVGVIVFTQPRPAFYRYLQAVVDAGFGNRVMFGSDQMVWPGVIERSVDVIREAPFLDDRLKRDILYDNAARFLRLSPEVIEQHHQM